MKGILLKVVMNAGSLFLAMLLLFLLMWGLGFHKKPGQGGCGCNGSSGAGAGMYNPNDFFTTGNQ